MSYVLSIVSYTANESRDVAGLACLAQPSKHPGNNPGVGVLCFKIDVYKMWALAIEAAGTGAWLSPNGFKSMKALRVRARAARIFTKIILRYI